MKVIKLFLIVLAILLVIPFVNASLSLGSFSSNTYNLGDKVSINGGITSTTTTRANLNLNLVCNGKSATIAVVTMNLKENELSSFSRFVTLPSDLLGACKVIANLNDLNGKKLDSKDFGGFELTNQLSGNFELNQNGFQLGDQLILKGIVTKFNKEPVSGTVLIYFKKNGNNLFYDTVEIVNGVADYKKTLDNLPAGDYSLTLSAKDNFGNVKNFNDYFKFVLNGNLVLNVKSDNLIYTPGDTIILNGYITNLQRQLKNLDVDFDFEGKTQSKELETSADTFTVNYIVPNNIKSGNHVVVISANDPEGNYGTTNVSFKVREVPTKLGINLDKTGYNPEEKVGFIVSLLDQAGDPIIGNINVDLLNVDGDVMNSKIVKIGERQELLLPMSAKVGSWMLKADGLGLQAQSSFNVNSYKKINATVKDSDLIINNVGNVPYEDLLQIVANNLSKSQKLKLDVGDSDKIELDDLFPSGSYKIELPSLKKYFNNIVIPDKKSIFGGLGDFTGNVVANIGKNTNSGGRKVVLFLSLLVLSCGLIYLIFGRNRRSKADFDDKFMKSLRSTENKTKVPERKVEYGKATKEDIEDWKKRVQKSFNEQNKDNSEREFIGRQQKSINNNKPGSGLFNMFN